MTNPKSTDDLDYQGSTIPVYFGAVRNTFTYKSFSLSANILYKLGYKFTRPAISYFLLYSLGNGGPGQAEYVNRWQKPGDERTTNVPSSLYPPNQDRDTFYQRSSAVVEDASHIRIQDITFSYSLDKMKWHFKNAKIFANLNNLGIIWSANKIGIDPDYRVNLPNPRSLTLGFNANF